VPSDLADAATNLLFLRHDAGNAYTLVRTAAASSPVQDGITRRFQLPLTEVLGRIRAAQEEAR
jgi:hypothetical protein